MECLPRGLPMLLLIYLGGKSVNETPPSLVSSQQSVHWLLALGSWSLSVGSPYPPRGMSI